MNVLCKLRKCLFLISDCLSSARFQYFKLTSKSTYFNFKFHIVKIMEVPLKKSPSTLFTLSNRIIAPPPGVPLHRIYSVFAERKCCVIHLLHKLSLSGEVTALQKVTFFHLHC